MTLLFDALVWPVWMISNEIAMATAPPVTPETEAPEDAGWTIELIIAALVAGTSFVLSGINLILTIGQNSRAKERAEKDDTWRVDRGVFDDARRLKQETWSRLSWALERAAEPATSKLGVATVIALLDDPDFAGTADARLALAVADVIWDDVEGKA